MCLEPALSSFNIRFVNNSQDTVGYTVYLHHVGYPENVVQLFNGRLYVSPNDTIEGGTAHEGHDDSWKSFYDKFGIDTLYVYVEKGVSVSVEHRETCRLPENDSNVLKIYKFYEDNLDLSQTNPIIVYP